jgi:hypothetical protein
MYNKNIISIIVLALGLSVLWKFSIPYKEVAIDPLKEELVNLESARDTFKNENKLTALESKINNLDSDEIKLLETYVPKELHSGKIAYVMSKIAELNKLNISNVQYAVIDEGGDKLGDNKKLSIDLQFEGYYENLNAWLLQVEKSDVLIDIESINATKLNNNTDILNINLKLAAYGVKID